MHPIDPLVEEQTDTGCQNTQTQEPVLRFYIRDVGFSALVGFWFDPGPCTLNPETRLISAQQARSCYSLHVVAAGTALEIRV